MSQPSALTTMKEDKTRGGIFIGDLPNEILEMIFSYIPLGSVLMEVAVRCRRFKALVMPVWYRTIRLRADFMLNSSYSPSRPGELPPGLVSEPNGRTLRSYPDFCKHVQHLSLNVLNGNWYTNAGGHQKLLRLLPNLKELSLNPAPKHYNFLMSDQLTTMRFYFPYDFRHSWTPDWPTPFDLNEYVSKPTLRRLQFTNAHKPNSYPKVHTGNPSSSTITDLRFVNWHIEDVTILGSVLASMKELKHFILEASGRLPNHPFGQPGEGLGPHDFGLLLEPQKQCLKELILGYSDEAYDSRHFPLRASPVIGSLSTYCALRRLAIPEPFLVLPNDSSIHQLLPPCLEELQIQIPDDRIPLTNRQLGPSKLPPSHIMRMKELARNKREFVPRLKRVVWWFQRKPQPSTPPWLHDSTTVYRLDGPRSADDPRRSVVPSYQKDMEAVAEGLLKVDVKVEFVLTTSFKNTPFAEYLYL